MFIFSTECPPIGPDQECRRYFLLLWNRVHCKVKVLSYVSHSARYTDHESVMLLSEVKYMSWLSLTLGNTEVCEKPFQKEWLENGSHRGIFTLCHDFCHCFLLTNYHKIVNNVLGQVRRLKSSRSVKVCWGVPNATWHTSCTEVALSQSGA